jgi:two-component system response regulator FixJ
MDKRSIYIVDDEDAIRRSLKIVLMVGGHSVSVFDSGASFLNVATALVPGAVLLDVRMPGMDGVEVQRHLMSARVDLPVVVMTGHGDHSLAVSALRQGAVAFLEKPFSKAALSQALDTAFLKLETPDAYEAGLEAAVRGVAALEDQDRALLAGLAAGWSNEKMAAELETSPAAAEMRRTRLYAELGISSLNEALRLAFAAGLTPYD